MNNPKPTDQETAPARVLDWFLFNLSIVSIIGFGITVFLHFKFFSDFDLSTHDYILTFVSAVMIVGISMLALASHCDQWKHERESSRCHCPSERTNELRPTESEETELDPTARPVGYMIYGSIFSWLGYLIFLSFN